jgi:hypothetical protein
MVRFVPLVSQKLETFKNYFLIPLNNYVMAEYIINCQANSLLEYTRSPVPQEAQELFNPFFTADFSREQISNLIADTKIRKSAGICLISGNEYKRVGDLIYYRGEKVYAFRVEWDSENLVRDPDLDSNQIVSAIITELVTMGKPNEFPAADPTVFSSIEEGKITWTQKKVEKYKPDPNIDPFFTFFDASTLHRLLADESNDYLRFRKALIRSKTKSLTSNNFGEEFSGLNFIVESVPTFVDKTENPSFQANIITDEDVIAHDYGYPCPPRWTPDTANVQRGYGVIQRAQLLQVANGISIRMGDIAEALLKNPRAKNLLKDWKLYSEPKTLRIFERGRTRRVVLE